MVEDDGPGIPPHALERVFERFYTDRPDQGFGQNSGLGLSISRQIVEAHRGTIKAENRPGPPDEDGRADAARRPLRRPPAGARPWLRPPRSTPAASSIGESGRAHPRTVRGGQVEPRARASRGGAAARPLRPARQRRPHPARSASRPPGRPPGRGDRRAAWRCAALGLVASEHEAAGVVRLRRRTLRRTSRRGFPRHRRRQQSPLCGVVIPRIYGRRGAPIRRGGARPPRANTMTRA